MESVSHKILTWLSFLMMSCLLSSCAHYQLGTSSDTNPQAFESIYVDWVINETFEADQVVVYTQALREAIIESGSLKLASNPVEADAILNVTIGDFNRRQQANRSDDTGLTLIYRNEVRATVSLIANSDGRIFLREQDFTVSADALAAQGLQAAEYQQSPVLARMLAQKVRDTLMSLNW